MVPFFSDATHMTFNGKSKSSFGMIVFCLIFAKTFNLNRAVKNSPAVSYKYYNFNIYALKQFKIPA